MDEVIIIVIILCYCCWPTVCHGFSQTVYSRWSSTGRKGFAEEAVCLATGYRWSVIAYKPAGGSDALVSPWQRVYYRLQQFLAKSKKNFKY